VYILLWKRSAELQLPVIAGQAFVRTITSRSHHYTTEGKMNQKVLKTKAIYKAQR